MTRDQFLVECRRAFEAQFPERADELMREAERLTPTWLAASREGTVMAKRVPTDDHVRMLVALTAIERQGIYWIAFEEVQPEASGDCVEGRIIVRRVD